MMLNLRRWMCGKKRTTAVNHLPLTIYHKPSVKGQVAVILVLVVAAALIFYAASLNLSRVSQVKTLTTTAANAGAALLGSYMASYGEQVFQTSLGGQERVCGLTGVVLAIVGVVVAIIAIIITASGGGPLGPSFYVAVMSAVLAVAALVLQLAVIQPGLTNAWNDIIWRTMSMGDAFVEEGVQTGLGRAVTDAVQVPDADDSDMDRLWGFDSDGEPLDKVSRFGVYYTKKRINTVPVPPSVQTQGFLDALRDFLLDDGDGWGIFDDTGPACATSECNPCCIPSDYWTEEMGCAANVSADPSIYVPDPGGVASMQATCEAGSPYGSNYPWVYDAYRGNPANAFVSFQEQLGRDDEHQLFEKNPADPNGAQISVLPPPPPLPPTNFKLKDTTGFYTPAVYPPADNRTGAYPFFYKIADWKVNLDLGAEPFDLTAKPNQCHWCDQREASVGGCPLNQPLEIPQLVLDPGTPPSGAVYNTTLCVDGTNLVSGNPPLAVDRVRLPDAATGLIEAAPAQCAQSALGDQAVGFWKRGGDRFCSASWPYYGNCPKEGVSPPDDGRTCGEAGSLSPENWPDDLVDDLVYGLNDFADWARQTLTQSASSLAGNLNSWYPEASQWIERGTNSGATNASTCTSCCYVCAAQDGALWRWYDEIREMKTRLEAWRDTSFAGATCTDVWCVPPAGCPASSTEASTFDANGNGIRGDITDIVACLDWNANLNGGNAQRFTACRGACFAADYTLANTECSQLPRSLIPGFDTTAYVPIELAELLACQASLTANCGVSPLLTCAAYGVTYTCSTIGSITTAINSRTAAGSCGNASFMASLSASIPEAQNQVVKFRKRHAFLSGRLAEMDNLISVLGDAESEFLGFLTCADADLDGQPDGAACRLIKDRNLTGIESERTGGLPYHAVYGWQSEPQKGQPPGSGKWHIVRVDARIPKRCDNSCNAGQASDGGDPAWPWVSSSTKNWGTKRCYELEGRTGVVKARVSRYDETNMFATLFFPNAVEIWKPMLDRSDRPQTVSSNPDNIEAACLDQMIPDSDGAPAAPGSDYYGAFIMNERNPLDPACVNACASDPDYSGCIALCLQQTNQDCWDLAVHLLSRGVTSETCAQYYFTRSGWAGFDFKFVPCSNF